MSDMRTVKGVFNHHLPNPNLTKLAKKLAEFEKSFRYRNKDHIRFFGGHILGSDKVRFLQSDFDFWFEEILGVDYTDLQEDLNNSDTINPSWSVSSSAFNLSTVWLVHIFWVSNLNNKIKHEAMLNALIILHYKLITSRLVRNFKFPASPELMETVYANMSKKYLIKQHGTWYKLIRARAEANIAKDSPHYRRNTWQKFNDDSAIIYALNDNSTRLSSIFKEHYKLINDIRDGDKAIVKTNVFINTDSGVEIAALSRELPALENYILSILPDKHSFIKNDIKYAIEKAMHKMPPSLFGKVLETLSREYQSDEVNDIIGKVLIHAFSYLFDQYEGKFKNPDLVTVISKLRGVYMSSKGKDPRLLELRKKLDSYISKRFKSSSAPSVAATRTGVMLYIVVRAIARKRYN